MKFQIKNEPDSMGLHLGIPRVARIVGTDEKYGFQRKWVSKYVKGDTYFFDIWQDGIYELRQPNGTQKYMIVVGNKHEDVSKYVPYSIGAYMEDNQCDRNEAYDEIFDTLQRQLAWVRCGEKPHDVEDDYDEELDECLF